MIGSSETEGGLPTAGFGGGKSWLVAAGWLAVCAPGVPGQQPAAQAAAAPEWQTAAGSKMAFEVASVRKDAGPFRPPMAHLPDRVATDRFAIEARGEGAPTKDQMRLMMQSLLAERFKLTVHFETQVVPVLAMVLAKPGKTGPKLRPHSEGVACEATPATTDRPPKDGDEVFPPVCDAYMLMIKPDKGARAGSRNTTMELLAGALSGLGRLERPVVDQTGLSGRFDLSLEWAPEPSGASAPNADATADLRGPEFLETLSEQLGVKLESTKAPLQVLVIDHVERPSEN